MKGGEFRAGGQEAPARRRFECPGRGDHEIWYSPITKRRFMVDARIKSRHWANHTLKQAGLPEVF